MALKLGKCRLCLKLGDFYSIFTVDNAVQLSEMVMECTRIKVYEGDGLPDKVCSECIQKLSSAYIFKQQCERADQELRRNYVPPPGFSVSPPPQNRQSSDSAFSTHTDSSNLKSSFTETKITPVSSSRKRSVESDGVSAGSQSHEYKPSSSKRVEELRRLQKRPRYAASQDSDYEDNGASSYIPETDSDEPLLSPNTHNCTMCPKTFKWMKSLKAHIANVHSKTSLDNNIPKSTNKPLTTPDKVTDNDKINCEKCGKSFKLQIMLKRHMETCETSPVKCISPKKELLISLEPIDGMTAAKKTCEYCNAKFKTVDNLEKHLRVVHAAYLKRDSLETKKNIIVTPKAKSAPNDSSMTSNVPCIYCKEQYDDYYVYTAHLSSCPSKDLRTTFQCPLCQKELTKKTAFISHLRKVHFEQSHNARKSTNTSFYEEFECRMCNKKLASQELLITHLAAHMSNIDHEDNGAGEDSRASTLDDSESVYSAHSSRVSGTFINLKCRYCDKEFKYKKALQSHEEKHQEEGTAVKQEPPDKPDEGLLEETGADVDRESESESSQDEAEDTNECDICEKQFSYKRLLIQHKKTKHNQCSGTKRAKINLKDCSVKCLICDVDMKVSDINEHNQTHIAKNMKPRNIYTCTFTNCNQKFKSCSNLANHIKLVHRLNQQQVPKKYIGANMADFCEVVVTKAEPLDTVQSHNGFVEVPPKTAPHINLSGFSCHVCGKKMPTLISLKRHVNWHTNVGDNIQKQYECFVCKESFRFQCHYKLHMRQHYHDTNLDPKLLTCSICNRKSKHLRAAQAHMNFHKQTRFQTKDYQCSICKRVFQYRKVYLSHMAIHYKKGESAHNTVVGDAATAARAAAAIAEGVENACHLCGKLCDSETSLKHHLIWHKSKTLLYGARHECSICQLQFTNKKHLELHTRSHYESEDGPFKCTVCGKGYTDEDYMKRHLKGHNFDHQSHKARIEKLRKGKVKCPICSRYYPDVAKLIRHLRRTHPESKMIKEDPDAPPPAYYSCKLCAKSFLDERRLKKHEEAHLRKPCFFRCKFCGKKTISLKTHHLHIKSHLTTKHTDKPLRCSHCDETFVLGYALHHHLRDAHGIKETWIADRTDEPEGPLQELQCSVCLKVLASKGNYERHIDYHNSLRCNYCFDYFGSLRFLEGHLAFGCEKRKLIGDTDSYPKKVKCELCYKAFSVQVKLDCHLRTAHGVRVTRERSEGKAEIVCDYCFKVFENEYALSTHKIYHRSVGYFGCIYCPRKFNTQQAFRRHKTSHLYALNADDPTKCEHCDETFVAFRDMIDHMRDAHNDDKDWIVMPKDSIEETCPICQKKFFNLHRHLDYHEENRCKKCGEYFYSTVEFDAHLCAIVSDDEEAAGESEATRAPTEDCAFCFKPITKKTSKKMHDSLHNISGAISCRFCPLKFKTIDAFNIHAFSHRSRKYVKKPIKCRICKEKFVKYGPFMKHMKSVHKSTKRVHYRAFVKPERCVVCGGDFPNLHNHYRAHLINRCKSCLKYFTSTRLFERHRCDEPDKDPDRVFTSDENLPQLINSYVPKDLKDDEKFYGYTDDEEEEEPPAPPELVPKPKRSYTGKRRSAPAAAPTPVPAASLMTEDERNLHNMVTSPIISDVLSLYRKAEAGDPDSKSQNGDFGEVVDLSDDSLGVNDIPTVVVVIDDDDD